MKQTPRTFPAYIMNLSFVIGLVSAIAFRSIIVFAHLDPRFIRPVWYFAVIGYIFFFLYRYIVSKRRRDAVRNYELIEKIRKNACLDEEERKVTIYLLSSLNKSRERLNYLLICILSVITIAVDIILSMQGR
ncbi:hypothetical protein ACFL5E_00810 [Candidatus Omnitrophota bacterium]